MPATIEELFEAHDEVIGAPSSADILYVVRDAADEADVRKAAEDLTPDVYNYMPRRSTRIEERINETTWKIRVHYEPYTLSPSGDSFTFDTSGGTQHVTQSLATRAAYAAPGFVAPDLMGAIGFDGERVNGVDITVPVFSFSETHLIGASRVNMAYKSTLFTLTGRVNSAPFRGFDAGTVLFLGASGQERDGGQWEITYRFAVSPNRSNIAVGSIAGIAKRGWDYLTVVYADVESEGVVIKQPRFAYVDEVYEEGDLSGLGI
jgi:hypothetical protein